MMRLESLVLAVAVSLTAVSSTAEEQPSYEVSRIADHIYELTTDGGGYTVKVIASVGTDGLLIVDAGQRKTVEALKTALRSISATAPAIVISTHSHIEHVGGNHSLAPEAVVIGHTALRETLRSGSSLFDEFSDRAIPWLTFTDSMSLFFNGEEIKLISFAGAHDNCDIVVWFTGSKVVCVGGLANGRHFPSVDPDGDVLQYPKLVHRLLSLLPHDVTIVPGHGEDGRTSDLRAFHDMLVETEAIVRSELAKGKDLSALQADDILKDYKSFECSYVSRNDWIAYLVQGILPAAPAERATPLFEPLYGAMCAGGPDSAIALYHTLKDRERDKYKFDEVSIVAIGWRLYENSRYAESIPFFQLADAEYPTGDYASTVHNLLGMAYIQTGDTAQAIKNLRECLRLAPDDSVAIGTLRTLED